MKESEAIIGGAALDNLLDELTGEPLHLGVLLRGFRTQTDMEQAELAQKLGLSTQNLCQIESGMQKISFTEMLQFADILNEPKEVFISVWTQDQCRQAGYDQVRVSVVLDAA